MTGRRRWLAGVSLAALVWLAGCATPPPPPEVEGGALTGRIAVRVDATSAQAARSTTAAFELRGDATRGRLDLTTPLGSMVAQAYWSPGQVHLRTPQGETSYPSLDDLGEAAFGERLPVAALFDWLHGRPWGGAPSQPLPAPSQGFAQLGWSVDLAGAADGRIAARRDAAPAVTVRAQLDRP